MGKFHENKFYEVLEEIFVGANIEGVGGYINLLQIKNQYYSKVLNHFKADVNNNNIIKGAFKEEFFEKLYTFFRKYFNESGSVYFTKTSNWQSVYDKVYSDNKDVILFWKTNMLYYVKTDVLFESIQVEIYDENNKKHIFYFDTKQMQEKKNNERKELIFDYVNKKGNVYHFNVTYSAHGRKNNLKNIQRESGISEKVLKRAFNNFSKQSEVDYFINKNAKDFLVEQLDLYLHQILLDDNNVFSYERLNQFKTLKEYAKKLIRFISQFEDELIRVWIKPKFSLDGNYIISKDKLKEETINKLINHKNWHKQITEWENLGMVEDYFNLGSEENKFLPIDTKYFKDLEVEILSVFDDIEEELDGRLVQSENFQALNMLEKKYNSKIQSIYIDPPFNTGKDFEYIDKYQDSTWLSIMHDRLKLAHSFLNKSGQISLHLDRYANYLGRYLLNDIFGEENYRAEIFYDTNGNTGFKTSKNNWFQNSNIIIQFAKSYNDCYFRKAYTLFDAKDYNKPKKVRKDEEIMWLDLFQDDTGAYIEKYVNNNLEKIYKDLDLKVDPIGMIWTDILSFLYTQVGNNESYFFSGGQKPEFLIARIINTSSKQKDYILDFFAGSGTTCAVAHKLNRKYLGIEMGEHFDTFYKNNTRIGLLGRIKNVIKGDKTFYALKDDRMSDRRPQLSRQINWQGGGFVKYYKLEQYEDVLMRMNYQEGQLNLFSSGDIFSNYIFFADKKFSDIIEIKNNKIKLDFDKLYNNIDWAETISNLTGMGIKSIGEKKFTLKDGDRMKEFNIDFNTMTEQEKMEFIQLIKPLIWWGD